MGTDNKADHETIEGYDEWAKWYDKIEEIVFQGERDGDLDQEIREKLSAYRKANTEPSVGG